MKLFKNARGNWFGSFLDQDGRRRYVSLKTKCEETAKRISEEIVQRELETDREPIHTEIERYIEFYRAARSEIHSVQNGGVLFQWASEMVIEHNCTCVQEISTEKMQRWFDAKRQAVKAGSAVAYVRMVQHFLGWAEKERNLILYNPARKVRLPKFNKAIRRRFLSLPDLQKLLDACEDPDLKFAIYCMSHSGMRYSEVDEARPEWFDLERKLIQIQASDSWQPKNGKNRVVPMTSEFYEFLKVYGLRSPFMLGAHKEHKGRWRYRYDIRRQLNQLTRELGIEISPHDLRRTFASLKVSSGCSIFKVAKWLGNRVEITESHYAHLSPADTDIDIGLERKTPAAA